MIAIPVLLWVLAQPGPEQRVIAAFDIESRGADLNAKTLENLTLYLSARLTERGFQVVPRDEVRRVLSDEKAESYKSCYDQACQIEVGKELAASRTLSTQILAIAGTCQVTSVLYDLRTTTTEGAVTVEAQCTEQALLEAIRSVAARIGGGAGAPQPVVGAAVTSPPASAPAPALSPVATMAPAALPPPSPIASPEASEERHDKPHALTPVLGLRWLRTKETTLAIGGDGGSDTTPAHDTGGVILPGLEYAYRFTDHHGARARFAVGYGKPGTTVHGLLGYDFHVPFTREAQPGATLSNTPIELVLTPAIEVLAADKDTCFNALALAGLRFWWLYVEGGAGYAGCDVGGGTAALGAGLTFGL